MNYNELFYFRTYLPGLFQEISIVFNAMFQPPETVHYYLNNTRVLNCYCLFSNCARAHCKYCNNLNLHRHIQTHEIYIYTSIYINKRN